MTAPIKDFRYTTIRILIDTDNLSAVSDIFHYIPVEVVAKDTGIDPNHLLEATKNVMLLTLAEIGSISEAIECDPVQLFKIVEAEAIRIIKRIEGRDQE